MIDTLFINGADIVVSENIILFPVALVIGFLFAVVAEIFFDSL